MQHPIRFDPYREQNFSDPAVAALATGRCLARLYFHLQQVWLLYDDHLEHDKSHEDLTVHHKVHFQKTSQILKVIASTCYLLDVDRPDDLFNHVIAIMNASESEPSLDVCAAVVADLQNDCRIELDEFLVTSKGASSPDGVRLDKAYLRDEELLRRFVDDRITPTYDKLRSTICDQLKPEAAKLLSLGMTIEEGLSRPDVFCFLRPVDTRDVLRTSADPTELEKELAELSDFPVDLPHDKKTESEVGSGTASREPGDLAPNENWWDRLRNEWRYNGFDVEALDLNEIRRDYRKRQLTRGQLRSQVERIFCLACRSLTKKFGDGRLAVTTDPPHVTFDGIGEPVEPEVAYLFAV